MLHIDSHGSVMNDKIRLNICHNIERGELSVIHGIVVHQTGSSTATATLNGYAKSTANGAHFLIDKDGTIFQTASLRKKTQHVGWIKSRCLVEKSCTPKELADLK
jgi:N-acetyl-anhydromuramyl-L-alanine amidase AmpD